MTAKDLTIEDRIALLENVLPATDDSTDVLLIQSINVLVGFTAAELRRAEVVKNADGTYSIGAKDDGSTKSFTFTAGEDTYITGLVNAMDTASELHKEDRNIETLWGS